MSCIRFAPIPLDASSCAGCTWIQTLEEKSTAACLRNGPPARLVACVYSGPSAGLPSLLLSIYQIATRSTAYPPQDRPLRSSSRDRFRVHDIRLRTA